MTFTIRDLRAVNDVLRETAREAVMPRFRNLASDAVRMKTGPLDLVTEADEVAEASIEAGLLARFPGCLAVGEEAAAADPRRLSALPRADLAFVVDPIDGTANFAAGLPLFGMMAAALVRGTVVAAAILDPVGDDTALALRGEGAWIETPGGRQTDLRVAAGAPLEAMTGMVSWRFLPDPERHIVCRNLPRVAASWDYRGAAHGYRLVAGGFAHFVFFNRLLPWDHAPGWLLHREAGGYSARSTARATIRGRRPAASSARRTGTAGAFSGRGSSAHRTSRTPTTSSVIARTGRSTHSGTRADR